MDTRLKEVDNAINQIAINPKVRYFLKLHREMTGEDYYYLFDLKNTLPMYHLTNEFIFDLMFYLKEQDIILSPINQAVNPEKFYNGSLKYEDLSYEEWRGKIFSLQKGSSYWPVQNVLINGNSEKVITYINSLIPSYTNASAGVSAVVLLKEKELSGFLKNEYVMDGAWCYIFDAKGNVITNVNSKTEKSDHLFNMLQSTKSDDGYKVVDINGEKMTLVYARSSSNGWVYIMVVPRHLIDARVQPIKRVFSVISTITLILGVIFIWFSAYKNSQPMRQIISNIKVLFGTEKNKSMDIESNYEYDYIENTISELFNDNESLKHYLDLQRPLFKASVIEKLLQNGVGSEQEADIVLSHLGLDNRYSYYTVIAVHINTYKSEINNETLNELDSARTLLNSCCEKTIGNSGWIHNVGKDKTVVILGTNFIEAEDYEKYIKEILSAIVPNSGADYGVNIFVGVGSRREGIGNIFISYSEALQALEYRMLRFYNGVCYYESISGMSKAYFFPLEVEMKIINLVKAGETKELSLVMQHIYDNNFVSKELSLSMIKQLMYELRGTALKISDQLELLEQNTEDEDSIVKLFSKFDFALSAEDKFNYFKEILLYLCDNVEKRKRSKNYILKEKVLNYIACYYTDSELTLVDIADKHGLSSGYLAHFIKEQTGESFSSYLETIRMRKAQEYLSSSDYSVNEIMNKIGYSNQSTFFKAFKRVYGITPTMVREVAKS